MKARKKEEKKKFMKFVVGLNEKKTKKKVRVVFSLAREIMLWT